MECGPCPFVTTWSGGGSNGNCIPVFKWAFLDRVCNFFVRSGRYYFAFFDDLRRIRLVIHGAVLTIRPITLELVAIIAIIFLELAVPLSIYGYVAGKDRSAIVAQLQKCYIEVGPIITRPLPKDISEADFNKYIEEANAWVNNCANWIGENIGTPARERFMDRTGGSAGFIFGAANKKHSDIILALTRFRQNLIGLIENGAWDK